MGKKELRPSSRRGIVREEERWTGQEKGSGRGTLGEGHLEYRGEKMGLTRLKKIELSLEDTGDA